MALKDTHPGSREVQAERRIKAFELRKAGVPYRTIAKQLGIGVGTAYKDVQNVLKPLYEKGAAMADEWRRLEDARLDKLLLTIAPLIEAKDIGAVGMALRISESRRKLWGLDMPVRQDITSNGETLVGLTINLRSGA